MTKEKESGMMNLSNEREVMIMAMMYESKEAFERVKRYLEMNQYLFEASMSNGLYLIKILE